MLSEPHLFSSSHATSLFSLFVLSQKSKNVSRFYTSSIVDEEEEDDDNDLLDFHNCDKNILPDLLPIYCLFL